MAKQENKLPDTWQGRMKAWGGGDFTFLSSDGESITFIVVGPPELLKSVYKGKEQERVGCPVVTENGYLLFVCGKRVARKLAKHEKYFSTNAIMVVRHGGEGDVNATYSVKVLPETETFNALQEVKNTDFSPEQIPESIKAVEDVMQG